MQSLRVEPKELAIVKNSISIESEEHKIIDYKNKVCVKPWGHEFLVYENNKIGIWYLKMKKNHSTSLHCHFKKDTFMIVLSGCAKIGLIDNKSVVLNTLQSIYIPKYKFHSVSSFSEETYILEIEIFSRSLEFSDKNDLLRIDDQYKRKPVGYESSVQVETEGLDTYGYYFLNEATETTIHNTTLSLQTVRTTEELCKLQQNAYTIIMDGEIFEHMKFYKEGSVLQINKSMDVLNNKCLVLTVDKLDWKEDAKIIYDQDQLRILKQTLDSEKKSIVLTSGCFDILHVGHLETLRKAKTFGDVLIVCLSSDEQIKVIKGPTRPINNYKDRINLFKTISYVDYVVLYNEEGIEEEETLGSMMKILDPCCWVKGSDYTVAGILKKHPYLRDIRIVPLVEEKSTTNIIKKILK